MGWFKDAREQAKKDPIIAQIYGKDGAIVLRNDRIVYASGTKGEEAQIKPLDGITARVESGEELQSRVTATRLLTMGVFAFAAKKKTGGEKFVTVEGSDFLWSVEVDRKKANDATRFAMAVNSHVKKHAADHPDEKADENPGMDDLMRLVDLKERGMLSDEEFAAAKKQLLGM